MNDKKDKKMNKYTIQFNIVGKGFNKIKDDKFTHNFFNWLDNWGNNYFMFFS